MHNVGKLLSSEVAQQIEQYLRINLAKKISVAELAALAGLSRSRFIPAFRTAFGLPPHQFLLSLRLENAEQLLSGTNLSLPEVAATSGFSSQAHLTNTMARRRLVTPGELRRRANIDATGIRPDQR